MGVLVLVLTVWEGPAELLPPPVTLHLVAQPQNRVLLYWRTESDVTNASRTALFPKYTVQLSTDLKNWRDSNLIIPQEVGGSSRTTATNVVIVPLQSGIYVRLLCTIDLRGANLASVDWRGVNLSRQDMSGAILTNALLTGANLQQAKLSQADLRRAYLDSAIADHANLEYAQASGADFSLANLQSTVLTRAQFQSANFSNCDLRYCQMDEANASDAIFYHANFESATMLTATPGQGVLPPAFCPAFPPQRPVVPSSDLGTLRALTPVRGPRRRQVSPLTSPHRRVVPPPTT